MNVIITGTVTQGRKIGRKIGFPTANISLNNHDSLQNGVYAAFASCQGNTYKALVNIGFQPTITSSKIRTLEAHLLNFTGDLYGQTLTVRLVQFIRPEQKFDTPADLTRQIEHDEIEINKILETCT